MSQLFSKKLQTTRAATPTSALFAAVKTVLDDANQGRDIGALTQSIATESLDDASRSSLNAAVDSYRQGLGRLVDKHRIALGLEGLGSQVLATEQIDAGVAGAVISGDVGSFLSQSVVVAGQGNKNTTFVGMEGLLDGYEARIPAFEDYDERDNRNVLVNTVTYNLSVARQSPFGEAFFQTVTVSNDNVGVQVSIRLVSVFEDVKRNVSGSLTDFKKRNIVRALIDSTILKNEQTRIVPVHRVASAAYFATGFTPAPYDLEGEAITTAPLKPGVAFDLIGLSQTDALLANGTMERSDQIDPAVSLENVYIKAGDDILKFPVSALALSNFVASPQDNYRRQNLNFHTTSLIINAAKKQYNGADLVSLEAVADDNLIVQLALDVTGYVNIELGDTFVQGVQTRVVKITNGDTGANVPLSTGTGATIAALFTAGSFVAYDLLAYRTNLNKRQRGQMLDTMYYNQIWAVPLRAPITVARPPSSDAQLDNADLAALVSATHARTSNEAVTTLLRTSEMLSQYVANNTDMDTAPELFGVARFLLVPTHISENLDVNAVINSISSHEKARDVQAAMVDKIRNIAYRMYRDSGFQAVVESQAAGVSSNPKLIIGTDPLTARYLLESGEPRLGGEGFEHIVVTTPDERMYGKIFIAFGYPEQGNGSTINPLHFGNMLWSPELVLVLPISRGGQTSKELTVQPRFRHIVNVPILGELNVTGITELMGDRVPLEFVDITTP